MYSPNLKVLLHVANQAFLKKESSHHLCQWDYIQLMDQLPLEPLNQSVTLEVQL